MNLNLLSIGMGLLGWGFAILAIRKRGSWPLMYLSMTACSLAQLVQFAEYKHLARIEDVSALLDTAGGRLFGAAVLVGVTVILNTAALLRKMISSGRQP